MDQPIIAWAAAHPVKPDRMRLLEAIEVLPSDALVPISWVRTLLAMAVNAAASPTEHVRCVTDRASWAVWWPRMSRPRGENG